MYLANTTKHDISFAMRKLRRFSSNPGDDPWVALERVLWYLRGTPSFGIHYTGYPPLLEGYSDANWITNANEIKTTSGNVLTLAGVVVSWRSCKQTNLTRSTMQAKLVALDAATVEVEWLREIFFGLVIG